MTYFLNRQKSKIRATWIMTEKKRSPDREVCPCLISVSAPYIPPRQHLPTWASSILNHVLLSLSNETLYPGAGSREWKDDTQSWNVADYDGRNTMTSSLLLWMIPRSKSYNHLLPFASRFKTVKPTHVWTPTSLPSYFDGRSDKKGAAGGDAPFQQIFSPLNRNDWNM